MINSTPWQQSLSNVITDFDELCILLDIQEEKSALIAKAQQSFSLRVPREFVSRMEKQNPHDPLLLQILPQTVETNIVAGFSQDPLLEHQKNPVPGLLHKYPNRVLLTLTGGCAINCRYCFRRHFPYQDNLPGRSNWQLALAYIGANTQIDEVILSGGDPMILKDHLMAEFVKNLEKIPHIKRLRIHTRLPIVIPSRVTDEWIAWMCETRFQMIVVLHCNHPNEIDDAVLQALRKLRAAPVTLLNQSVLLKNVNDHADILSALSKRLFEAGVLPYYLHLLDKVDGAAHFDVTETAAHQIMKDMKAQLPGFLVPKLAREVSGMLNKDY